MPGTRPGMTSFEESAWYHWLHFESDSQTGSTSTVCDNCQRNIQR